MAAHAVVPVRVGRLMPCVLAALAVLAACGSTSDFLLGPGEGVPRGASIFGVDDRNTLASFGRSNPTRAEVRRIAITGLVAGETVIGVDFRAHAPAVADRALYAITTGSRLYVVDTTSGVATAVAASAFSPAITGTSFGVDFNPQADRLRLHSDADANLRLDQRTGAVAAVDTALAYAAGDANAGRNPAIVGTAYSNNVPAATATDLFAIDSDRGVLVFLASPNSGRLTTRGSLGIPTTSAVGFDIVGAGFASTAYVTLTPLNGTRSALYTINLASGAATLIGDVNHDRPLVGIAAAP